jgi:nucleoside-diphosphate-sugar epimerase
MRVLVTGASGRLGRVTCAVLLEHGFDVRATDRKVWRGLTIPVTVADLCDETCVYGLIEGCDAVVHLGNFPHLGAGPTAQTVLVDNTAMNTHVFRAAVDLGVKRLVFASSIQAMMTFAHGGYASRKLLPFLPLDGTAPVNPGTNFYGLSKEFGERMLSVFAAADPLLACTALRFPYLLSDGWKGHNKSIPTGLDECLTYLPMRAAGELIACALTHQKPGYHQYFPAQTMSVTDAPVPELIRRFYAMVPLRKAIDEIDNLVDLEGPTTALSWTPPPRRECKLDDLDL